MVSSEEQSEDKPMGFTVADLIIVMIFLVGVTYLGIRIAGKQKNVTDYFLGGRNVSWWMVSLAIVATETSVLTFISIPGLAYVANLNFLQITFGYFIGRILVAYIILPAYFRGEISTAYSYLAYRFGNSMKNIASGVFMLTRLAADGVRLFATAIPLAIILSGFGVGEILSDNLIYMTAILLIAGASLTYTYAGGLRAVIWMDVVQLFTYVGGAVAAVFILFSLIPLGLSDIFKFAVGEGKLEVFNFSFEDGITGIISTPYTFIASLIGGMLLSMASHGTDQLIVQRLLSTGNLKNSRKALISTGFIIIFQFLLFLIVGVLLYVYYAGGDIKGMVGQDEVFPIFIIEEMPSGLSGLIIASLFAAAMSTISSSITALSSATMYDYLMPYSGRVNNKNELSISRFVTLMWAFLLVLSAFLFMRSTGAVVELALGIASYTYGGLLGVFILGVLIGRVREREAVLAFISGLTVMLLIIVGPVLFENFITVAWTWYILICGSFTVITAILLSYLRRD